MNANQLRRLLARIVPVDLPFWLTVPPLYAYTLGAHDPVRLMLVGAVGNVLRLSCWCLIARAHLAPVTAWENTPAKERTPQDVADAAASIHHASQRLSLWFALLWLAWMACIGFFAVYDAPNGLGPRFWMVAVVASFTPPVGAAVMVHGIVAATTRDTKATLMAEAVRLRLPVRLAPTMLKTQIALLGVTMALCPIGWLGAIGMRAADEGASVLAQERAQRTVLELRTATTIDDAERASVGAWIDATTTADETSALPASAISWARKSAATHPDGVWLDREADRAFAFTREDDGRIAVAVVAVPTGPAHFFLYAVLGFMVVVSFWAPISAYAFGFHVGENVRLVMLAVGRMADVGDLDEMKEVPRMSGDETGELARHFNELLVTLRDLMGTAKLVAEGDLSVDIDAKGDLPDAFRGMLANLRDLVARVRETAADLTNAAAEIYSASQEQEAAAAQQASGLTEVSTTIESLSSAAGHVAEATSSVLQDAEGTHTTTEQMATRIAELNGHAGRIEELLGVIREVADRSDLLALNGSLEAARAGEAGRGFALVAAEMRRLAERVTATVESVRHLLSDIRTSGSASVMATDQSRKYAESTSDAARHISLLTQQQRTAMEQVSSSAHEIAGVIAQTASASTQQRVAAEGLKTQADRLELLLNRFVLESV